MKIIRRRPDHEAENVLVKADKIDKPQYFYGSDTHGRNRVGAKGNVEVIVKKQHPDSKK